MRDGLDVPEFHPVPVAKKTAAIADRTWKTVALDALEKALPWMLAFVTLFALLMAMITY